MNTHTSSPGRNQSGARTNKHARSQGRKLCYEVPGKAVISAGLEAATYVEYRVDGMG